MRLAISEGFLSLFYYYPVNIIYKINGTTMKSTGLKSLIICIAILLAFLLSCNHQKTVEYYPMELAIDTNSISTGYLILNRFHADSTTTKTNELTPL